MQEAWDSYIQNGNAVDPALQFYPTAIGQTPPNPDAEQIDQATFGNSVFMGANTPGR